MAKKYLLGDKVNVILSLIPVAIGAFLYSLLGTALFSKLPQMGQEYINQYFSGAILGEIISYIIVFFLSILMFVLIKWTFVLVVMIFASPFYDALSRRIEREIKGEKKGDKESTWKMILGSFFWIIWNEIKKVSVILILSIIAFVLSYIPILTPISFIVTTLLFCVQFLDYTWSRNDINSKKCWIGLRKHIWGYLLMGGMLFICMSIPIFNLLIPAFATAYFTVLWTINQKDLNEKV